MENKKDVTLDKLITHAQALIDIEAAHPDLLSTSLLKLINEWLALESDSEKTAALPNLHLELLDAQNPDLTGTPWEAEWLADGKVCTCPACVATREFLSDISKFN